MEPDVKIPPSKSNQQPLQTSKPANKSCIISPRNITVGVRLRKPSLVLSVRNLDLPAGVVESLLDCLKAISALQPGPDFCCTAGRGQPDHRSTSHAVSQDSTASSTCQLQDRTGDQCATTHPKSRQQLNRPFTVAQKNLDVGRSVLCAVLSNIAVDSTVNIQPELPKGCFFLQMTFCWVH